MYRQVLDPVSHSLGITSIFAVLPLLVLFVLLGIVRMKAQWASLITLGVAIVIAIAVYSMPVGQAFNSGAEGAAFGLFPIMWGTGTGSEVMQRIAAPMVGGMITAPLLSMFVVPVAYLLLRRSRAGVQAGAPRNQLQGGAPT